MPVTEPTNAKTSAQTEVLTTTTKIENNEQDNNTAANHSIQVPAPILSLEQFLGTPETRFPELKEAALHGLAGKIVRTVCAESEAHPAAVLATLLTAYGAAIGPRCAVQVGNDRHPARLFTVIAGKTGKARKGTSRAPITDLLDAIKGKLPQDLQTTYGPLSSGEGIVYAVRNSVLDPQSKETIDIGIDDKRLLVLE